MQARHEYKHSLNCADYIICRDRLKRAMRRDSHADENGEYRVRSLYFDTPSDKALREKIDGVDRREKFRVRRYIGGDGFMVLEKKSKLHGLCYKRSCPFSGYELAFLEKGDLQWMSQDSRDLVRELYFKMMYEQLRPKTIVEYIREPFVYPAGNVRVTFDRDIRTGLFSTDFMNDSVPTAKAGDELVLLEVKYDQFIPDF
ncbi:MAG: polyphosphate polymerase domain-containing protein, partial [Clostridiales bacterium]|nr:polyphosphate polymerase domain-containing protein [Clostridiales bacterium]